MPFSIRAVIFDLDGLLLDTERLFDEVFKEYVLLRTGKPMEESAFLVMRSQMFGRSPIVNANKLHELLGINEPGEVFLDWRRPRIQAVFPNVKLLPGAETLVRSLAKHAIPIAIATSSDREFYKLKTAAHQDFFGLFRGNVLTSEDVYFSKPAPDIFLMAAVKLEVPHNTCLVFEDAPSGVEAARSAKMHVIAVPHPLLDRTLVSNADEVLVSLEQFDASRWGLPS